MFAHKEISHKVRGPTRSENARHLLEWVYRKRCVHILYTFWAYYTQYLCWFSTVKSSPFPPLHHADAISKAFVEGRTHKFIVQRLKNNSCKLQHLFPTKNSKQNCSRSFWTKELWGPAAVSWFCLSILLLSWNNNWVILLLKNFHGIFTCKLNASTNFFCNGHIK